MKGKLQEIIDKLLEAVKVIEALRDENEKSSQLIKETKPEDPGDHHPH